MTKIVIPDAAPIFSGVNISDTVTIPKADYENLVEDVNWLRLILQEAGIKTTVADYALELKAEEEAKNG